MRYKYWSKYNQCWQYTDIESTAKNASYYSHKPYYKLIGNDYIIQDIPDMLDMSNTDTFHLHEAKGERHK